MEKHREQRDRERETERYTETQPGRQAWGRWATGGRAGIEKANKGRVDREARGGMGSSGEQGVSEGTGVWWQELGWLQVSGRMGGVRMGRESLSERGQVCEQGGRSAGRGEGWGAGELEGDAETHTAKVTRWTDASVEEGGHLIGRCGS